MGLSVRIAQEKTQKSDQQFNLMSVKMGNDEMYTIVVKQGMVHYVYDGKGTYCNKYHFCLHFFSEF